MVKLSEMRGPCLGLGDRGILIGGLARTIDRYGQQRRAAGRENAVELRHGPAVIGDMLEDMVADDEVEGGVGEGHFLDGKTMGDARSPGADIGTDIKPTEPLSQ